MTCPTDNCHIFPYTERSFDNTNKNAVIGIGLIHRTQPQDFFINQSNEYFLFDFHLEGKGMVIHEGSEITAIDPPCIYLFAENEHYSIVPAPDSSWTEFCIRIDPGIITALTRVGLMPLQSGIIKAEHNSVFFNWMSELSGRIRSIPSDFLYELFFDVQKFLISICNFREQKLKASYNYPMITEAEQIIRNAVSSHQGINSRMLADHFHVSINQFTSMFRLFTGKSPGQYLIHCRIHYAQRLLDSGVSVKETAEIIGYADPFIFSKQFKKYTGKSPREYKLQNIPSSDPD